MIEDDQGMESQDETQIIHALGEVRRFDLEGIVDSDGQRVVVLGLWTRTMRSSDEALRFFLTPERARQLRKALEDVEWWENLS